MKKILILILSLFIITPVYAHKKKYTNKQNKYFHSGALKKKKYKNQFGHRLLLPLIANRLEVPKNFYYFYFLFYNLLYLMYNRAYEQKTNGERTKLW